jgi:hypothetical protein
MTMLRWILPMAAVLLQMGFHYFGERKGGLDDV